MRRLLELPRVIVTSSATSLGISTARMRTELRRGNWRTIARGAVLTRPEEPTRADWAALGIALGGPSAALSGWDAVRVRGLGSAPPPSEEVLVLSRHAANRVVGNVRIRETQRPYRASTMSADAPDYSLIPVVATARAVADTARYYRTLSPVRALVTSAVQRRRCTLVDLLAELRSGPRNGTAHLREALADAVDGARSEAEAKALRRLTRERVPPFELNVPIVGRNGYVIAVADVLWRSLRAVLEIDSREYHFSEGDWKHTMKRHNLLTRLGLAVTHYPPSVIAGSGRGWVDEVGAWLAARSVEIGVPAPCGHGVIRPPATGPAPFLVATL